MLQPEQKTIDGMAFQFIPMAVLKASRLDKRVLALLAPVVGSLSGLDLDSEVDADRLARGVASALQSMDDQAFTSLLRDTLDTVVYLPEGMAPLNLGNENAINQAFTGRLDTLYKVVVEVMRYNRFTPFALLGTFGNLAQTLGLSEAKSTSKKRGLKLAKSDSSTPT